MARSRAAVVVAAAVVLLVAACGAPVAPAGETSTPRVLAIETFLADIAQNVAGDRLKVDTLIPAGVDPHAFEPAPADVAKVANSQVLIANGAGLEEWLSRVLTNAGGKRQVVEAAKGLPIRAQQSGEAPSDHPAGDPHFWLDPNEVITYTTNIRDGLTAADPAGAATYAANADAYIKQLQDLDASIKEQVNQIPEQNRKLVTNHETFGYFADRYGFTIVGTILASVSSVASPSAQDMTRLVQSIRDTKAKAVFLEQGTNPQLANQISSETGAKVVEGLYTHSLSKGPPAGSYIDMMKYDVSTIVNALR